MAASIKTFTSTNPYIRYWTEGHEGSSDKVPQDILETSSPEDLLRLCLHKISLCSLTTKAAIGKASTNLVKFQASHSSDPTLGGLCSSLQAKIASTAIDRLSLYQLLERRARAVDPALVSYLNMRIEIRHIEITRSTHMEGFFFKVTNHRGVTSYLIGVSHKAPEHCKFSEKTRRIVDASSEVISELGSHFSTFAINIADEILYQDDPLRFSMDHQIIKHAITQGIPITPLSDPIPIKDTILKLEKLVAECSLPNQTPPYLKIHKSHIRYEILEAMQTGNYEELTILSPMNYPPKGYALVVTERNHQWLFDNTLTESINRIGLVRRLQDTRHPIALSIGVCHLANEGGIVHLLQQQGLTVERDLS